MLIESYGYVQAIAFIARCISYKRSGRMPCSRLNGGFQHINHYFILDVLIKILKLYFKSMLSKNLIDY